MDLFTHHHKSDRKLRKLQPAFCLPTSPGDEKPRNNAVLEVDPTRPPAMGHLPQAVLHQGPHVQTCH